MNRRFIEMTLSCFSYKDSKFVGVLGLHLRQACCSDEVLSFLFQSPEVKYPVELMAIPTCQMDPMLFHHLQLMGAIHTHLLLQVSLETKAGDYSSE